MKRLKKFVKVVFLLLAITMAALYFFQEKIIFLPTQLEPNYQFTFDRPFNELFLETEDGAMLNALHFKVENPKGMILYFHGNSGDLARWGAITEYFHKYDYEVLVFDYRTYGKSTGKLNEQKMYSDALMIYSEAKKFFSEDQISVHGRSLGCTFAAYVASKNNPKQLVLETPFYSLRQLVKERYPLLPVDLLLKYKFPTNEFVETIFTQTTIIHGTLDKVVPYGNGKMLYDLFPQGKAEFITMEDGEHNDLTDFEIYHQTMDQLYR